MKRDEKWTQLIKYINNQPIDTIILRQDILSINKGGDASYDEFRLWLTHCKYLQTIEKGKYKILKHIDPRLSSNEIKRRAYDEEYRINCDRFEKLTMILNEKI